MKKEVRKLINSLEALEALTEKVENLKEERETAEKCRKMAYFISQSDAEEYVKRLAQIKPGDTIKTLDGEQFVVTRVDYPDSSFPFFVVASFIEHDGGVFPDINRITTVPSFCLDLGVGMAIEAEEHKEKFFAALKATGRF